MRISTDVLQTIDENGVNLSGSWLWVDADTYDSSYRQVLTQPISLEAITLDFCRWKLGTVTLTIREGYDPSSDVIFCGEAALIDDVQGGGGSVSSVFGRIGDVVASENDYSSFYPKSDLVTQSAHNFVVGQPVRVSVDEFGVSSWMLAQATANLSQVATHFVVAVVDANTFRVSNAGFWAIPGLAVYGPLLLSATAGGVVSSALALPSNVAIQPLGIADATGLHINILSYVRDLTP